MTLTCANLFFPLPKTISNTVQKSFVSAMSILNLNIRIGHNTREVKCTCQKLCMHGEKGRYKARIIPHRPETLAMDILGINGLDLRFVPLPFSWLHCPPGAHTHTHTQAAATQTQMAAQLPKARQQQSKQKQAKLCNGSRSGLRSLICAH